MIVNFSNYINETTNVKVGYVWSDEKNESIKHADIDPYGEENWVDDDETENALRYRRIVDEHARKRIRGDEMLAGWAGQRNFIKPKFYEKDKKIVNVTTNFDYGGNVGNLVFSDFYTDRTHEYHCPKCGKSSFIKRDHGDVFKCGKCGLYTRICGNGLYVWE